MAYTLRLFALVVVWAVSVVPVYADGDGLPRTGITVTRRFTFDGRSAGSAGVDIIGLAAVPDGNEVAVGLRLRSESSGWLPAWYVVLDGAAEWLPSSGVLRIGPVQLVQGATYEAALSYHEASGVLSFALKESGSDSAVVQESWILQQPGRALHPLRKAGDVTVAYWYQPVGLRWDTVVRSGQTEVPLRVLEDLSQAGIRVRTQPVPDGVLRLVVRSAGGDSMIPLGAITGATTVFSLADADFAMGSLSLRMQYVLDGAVAWESDWYDIRFGRVTARPQGFSVEAGDLAFTLHVTSTGALSDIRLALVVQLAELAWDPARRAYTEVGSSYVTVALDGLTGVPDRTAVVPVVVPLPDKAAWWRVRLALEAEPSLAAVVESGDVTVSTVSRTIVGQGAPAGRFRICTYNMHNFAGYPDEATVPVLGGDGDARRTDHFIDVIRRLGCDVLGVQEAHSVDRMRQVAQRLGVNLAAFPSATEYPGAVLTRFPIIETRYFNHAGPANQDLPFSRFAGATLLSFGHQSLWVVNLHASPHDEALRAKEAAVLSERLRDLLQVTPHVVVLGSFNASVGDVLDGVLTELGLVNVMNLDVAGGQRPTVVTRQAAIDHIYVSRALAGVVTVARVYDEPGFAITDALEPGGWVQSDHLPVMVELKWP